MKNKIKLFQKQKVRSIWDENLEEWFFSIIDIVKILIDQSDYQTARKYWNKLAERLRNEGSQVVTKCHRLKLLASDGKIRETDVADVKTILRLIQSIPSPKAEPFKLWLAEVGNDRINESQDPELAIDRAMISYRNLGYSEEWINTRLQSIQFRKELTDEWKKSGVREGSEFAALTNIMTKEWAGKTIKEYKKFKGLKKESLRDNMTSLELALNILAETSTTELSKVLKPNNIDKNKNIAERGGKIAGDARRNIEAQTKRSIISPKNSKSLRLK